jgi:hypothetical protein
VVALGAIGLGFMGLSLMSKPALAFDEQTIGVGSGDAKAPAGPTAPILELPKDLSKDADTPDKTLGDPATKGLSLKSPEVSLTPGTEIKVPGFGTVGVLPNFKLDFGLELLYGQGEQKGPIDDKSSPDDVQLRGTIKHRF